MPTQFVTAQDGTRIAYDKTGQGPALLLLHGAGKTRKDWHKVGYVARLKQNFTVITVDIRGSGQSDIRTEIGDYALEQICADLVAVADVCEARQFAVLGFSFGGNIGRYLGARLNRVTALVAVGVPFGPAVDEAFGKYIDEFVHKWTPTVQAYREGKLSDKEGKSVIKGRIPVWWACFQAMRHWPSVEASQVNCPMLLVVGSKNDNTLKWVQSNRPALDQAKTRVEVIEGLNHQQEFSKIDAVYPVIHAFLQDHKPCPHLGQET